MFNPKQDISCNTTITKGKGQFRKRKREGCKSHRKKRKLSEAVFGI